MKNNYYSSHLQSQGVRSISFLFLICLFSLNIESCRQLEQVAPVKATDADKNLTVGISNAAELTAEAFRDAVKNKVLQQGNNLDALQTSMMQTIKRLKGVDYYNKVVENLGTDKSKKWSIQDESISQYADRKFTSFLRNNSAREAALSSTFKEYLEVIKNSVAEGGHNVVDLQESGGTVNSQLVSEQLGESLNKLDITIRNDLRLSDDEKQVLLATTSFSRTTSGPVTELVNSAFSTSSHGRVSGWGWFRAICNIVLTVAVVIAVTVAVAALAVAVLPATLVVLGVTIAEGTVVDAIIGGGVGALVTDALSGSYMCFIANDAMNCN